VTVEAIVQFVGVSHSVALTYAGQLQYLSCPEAGGQQCSGHGSCIQACSLQACSCSDGTLVSLAES